MSLSAAVVFGVIIFLLVAVLSSKNHLEKASFTLLFSFLTVALLIFIDRRLNLKMNEGMMYYFRNLGYSRFKARGLSEEDIAMTSYAAWFFLLFAGFFVIYYVIFSFVPFVSVPGSKRERLTKGIFSVLYAVLASYFLLFFVKGFSPVISLKFGFLDPLASSLGWRYLLS